MNHDDWTGNADHSPPPGYTDPGERQTSAVFNYAVISDEGLILYVNLTKAEAKAHASCRRNDGKVSWAVPMEDAAGLQADWSRLHDEFERACRLAQMTNVTNYLREANE